MSSSQYARFCCLAIVTYVFCASSPAQEQTTVTFTGPEKVVSGVYDSGSVTLTVAGANGIAYSSTVRYGQFTTAAGIASAFGGMLSEDPNSPANAQATGEVLTIQARQSQGGILQSVSVSSSGQFNSFSGSTPVPTSGTSTVLTASSTAVFAGETLQLSATVSPTSVSGTVTFTDGAGFNEIAPISSGTAAAAVSSLSVGSHSITATYSGDVANLPSTSPPTVVNVGPHITGTSLPEGPPIMGFVIMGAGFGTQGTVTVGGQQATVVPNTWTSTSITVQVPAGANSTGVVVNAGTGSTTVASNTWPFKVDTPFSCPTQ